ncbi:uncharacterized protein LY79DRAFT_585577 [Colletotrichum navitas]|uniref:Uncharacterized protein n=1 Tax=Colletotrichum navitas TaxID=681940 RepID=A0AAD8PIC5_9PEZI|nr:uncharacterized protein LY79DRAFT_585577 [Colletotrichum navitas]KAK1561311.1 hypothetical protein LY79DRAFT_585577 [Colletotrichum navitas]
MLFFLAKGIRPYILLLNIPLSTLLYANPLLSKARQRLGPLASILSYLAYFSTYYSIVKRRSSFLAPRINPYNRRYTQELSLRVLSIVNKKRRLKEKRRLRRTISTNVLRLATTSSRLLLNVKARCLLRITIYLCKSVGKGSLDKDKSLIFFNFKVKDYKVRLTRGELGVGYLVFYLLEELSSIVKLEVSKYFILNVKGYYKGRVVIC